MTAPDLSPATPPEAPAAPPETATPPAARPGRAARAAQNRWLPVGRRGPMPWIIAIMMFLTLLSATAALALGNGLARLHGDLEGGYTVQIVEPNAAKRAAQTARLADRLRRLAPVAAVTVVPEDQLRAQLAPWLGADAATDGLPIPALIDIRLRPGAAPSTLSAITGTIRQIAPTARLDAHETYLAPVERLMRLLMGLAGGLVLLMVLVTIAVVMLAARSAYGTHSETIDIMHLLGATDIQIARLFQRRMALDALFGCLVGLGVASVVLAVLGREMAATGSELTGMLVLPAGQAAGLILLPLMGVGLAMLTARTTVRRALEKAL